MLRQLDSYLVKDKIGKPYTVYQPKFQMNQRFLLLLLLI